MEGKFLPESTPRDYKKQQTVESPHPHNHHTVSFQSAWRPNACCLSFIPHISEYKCLLIYPVPGLPLCTEYSVNRDIIFAVHKSQD